MLNSSSSSFSKVSQLEVYQSSNYDLFTFDKSNRPIIECQVLKIAESMRRDGFLTESAISVVQKDNKLVVADGQHRFMSARSISIPVKFLIAASNDVHKEMIRKNDLQRAWRSENFLHFHATNGRFAYRAIHEFILKYDLNITFLLEVMFPSSSTKRSDSTQKFRDGLLTLTQHQYDTAKELFEQMTEIRNFDPSYNIFRKQNAFLRPLKSLCAHTEYDHDLMMLNMKEKGCWEYIKPCRTQKQYEELLSRAYNHKKKNRMHFGGVRRPTLIPT